MRTEKEIIYYERSKSKKNASGKLYNFYTNLRKWLKRDEDTEQEKILEITATDKSNLSELQNLSEDVEKLKQL